MIHPTPAAAPETKEVDLESSSKTHLSESPTCLQRLQEKVYSVLNQNLSPAVLSLSFAVGFTTGLFPIPGVTSVVTIGCAMLMGLNIPAAQLVNLLLTPVDIACVPLFLYFGGVLLGRPPVSLNPASMIDALKQDFKGGIVQYGSAIGTAVFGWMIFCPVATAMLHFALHPILRIYWSKTK